MTIMKSCFFNFQGGKGGRIVNIASMAGLLEGLGTIEDSGYCMAKFGVVALTRSFGQQGRRGPWKRDGIKAMALCPWFANTQLVTSSTDLNKLKAATKERILEVPEVIFPIFNFCTPRRACTNKIICYTFTGLSFEYK
jgi:NAD(P)-dependent dehydrogenase (short-subunit alcohol dehydrogenase family)